MGERKRRSGLKISRALTPKQKRFVKAVERLTPEDGLPTNEVLQAAAIEAYNPIPKDPERSITSLASTIAGQNMRNPAILEALGITPQAQHVFQGVMWKWLMGMDAQHPEDKDLKMKAASLLSRALIPDEQHLKIDDDRMAARSEAELEYFAKNGYWPEEAALNHKTDA